MSLIRIEYLIICNIIIIFQYLTFLVQWTKIIPLLHTMNIVCKLQTPNLHFTVSSAVARGSLCYEGYFHKFQEAPTEKSEFV